MRTNHRRSVQLGIAAAAMFGIAAVAGNAEAQRYSSYDRHDRYADDDVVVAADHDDAITIRDRRRFDTDRDGQLCDTERAALTAHYFQIDDRALYRPVRRFARHERVNRLSFRFEASAEKFAAFDSNRDGVLTWRETPRTSWVAKHFDGIDRNGDDLITPREMDRYFSRNGRLEVSSYRPGVLSGASYRYDFRLHINS
jgi:hypothetical protein